MEGLVKTELGDETHNEKKGKGVRCLNGGAEEMESRKVLEKENLNYYYNCCAFCASIAGHDYQQETRVGLVGLQHLPYLTC